MGRRLKSKPEKKRAKSRELACSLVADDALGDRTIAKLAGIDKATLERWKRIPEFAAEVLTRRAKLRTAQLAVALKFGVATAQERMRGLQDVWDRNARLMQERSRDPLLENIPGGQSGLLVRRLKTLRVSKRVKKGKGYATVDLNQIVEEFRSDLGPVSKAVEIAEQAAKQVGEWVEKHQQVDTTSPEAIALAEIFTIEELKAARERIRHRTAGHGEPAGSGPGGPVSAKK